MNVRKKAFSLKSKILIATIIPVIITFTFIFTFIVISFDSFSNELAKMKFLERSRKYASNFEKRIGDAMNYLTIIATDLEIRVLTKQTNREALQRTVYSVFSEYNLIDGSSIYFEPNMFDDRDSRYANSYFGTAKSGRICWYFYKDGENIAYLPEAMKDEIEFEMPHYTMAKDANKPIYTDPVTYEVEGENIHMFTLTHPVKISNIFIGAVTVDVFLDDLYKELQNEKIYDTGYIGIYNGRSAIVYCPIYEYIGKTREKVGLDDDLNEFHNSAGFLNVRSMINGKDSLAVINSIYISQLDSFFYISVTAPLEEIYAENRITVALFFGLSTVVIFLIALLIYCLIRKISAPIDEITHSVDKIAGGEYTARIEGTYKGEFAVVKESVNKMAGSIETYINESKKSIKILEDAKEQAEQGSRSKSEFLSRMSHEMRTPMNAIIGMTGIAKNSDDAAMKEYCLDRINEASRHLLGVINDVLDMSKIEADKLELNFTEFNFEQMLSSALNVVKFRMDEKKQNFFFSIDSSVPAYLIGDEQRLTQVIANLLSNAVKFTPDLGSIRFNARTLAEEHGIYNVQIEIIDSGIGISKEQQSKLFQSFEQADGSITRKYGGTGLGLVISKRIIELMGGDIWIESELGKGSAFIFTFKAEKAYEKIDPKPLSELSGGADANDTVISFEGKTALLAEDIELNREIVLAMLEETKLKIDCVENGQEAVDTFMADPNKYDIIFMDMQMPDVDGLEATRRIRASGIPEGARVPIIAMTANVFREDIEKCLKAGMNDHIGKPIDFNELIQKIKSYF